MVIDCSWWEKNWLKNVLAFRQGYYIKRRNEEAQGIGEVEEKEVK